MKIKPVGSNMTELRLADGTVILFSYETSVAYLNANGYAKTDQYYSVTTSRHINKWVGASSVRVVTQAEIDALVEGVKL